MLYELESNWIHLERCLKEYAAKMDPALIPMITEWLEAIRNLPIAEKTLYLAELAEPLLSQLATQREKEEWEKVKQSMMTSNKLQDISVIKLFENTMDSWVHISRKKG